MVMWVMSDRAIPRSYRMMEGFGVHTFRLVNAAGESSLVKFHWKPKLGAHSLVWDEAQLIAGRDPDFHRRDLWEPSRAAPSRSSSSACRWCPRRTRCAYGFDLLDPTKLLPEELVPVRLVGKMTLTRNPANFFSEVEQVAFCVANLVPGIDVTDDPLLQARLFSYLDTQLTRLGGPNFAETADQPADRPGAQPPAGRLRTARRSPRRRPTTTRTRIGGGVPQAAGGPRAPSRTCASASTARSCASAAAASPTTSARPRCSSNSLSGPERQHLIDAFRFELGKVDAPRGAQPRRRRRSSRRCRWRSPARWPRRSACRRPAAGTTCRRTRPANRPRRPPSAWR